MNPDLLNQPWQIQVAIGSGYAGYMVAYLGLRDHHKAADALFRAIAFSLVATAVLSISGALTPFARGILAFLTTVAAGAFWRRLGIKLFEKGVRAIGTRSDDWPSAWAKIALANDRTVSQLAVELDDGTWLYCHETAQFADAPHDACTFGGIGDLALYVTHKKPQGVEQFEVPGVIDEHHGTKLTYVPASRIRSVTVRYV